MMKMNPSKIAKKRGVLIVNLGTPQSYQPKDVYRYLTEFLTDARVIDTHWLKRQLLVRGIIVPSRYRQSAEQYRRLWTKEGSPLLHHGKRVQEKLQQALGSDYHVVLAMRYQTPSILEGLAKLQKEEVDELIILPLFPQYASATTGSVHQKVMECLRTWPLYPKLIFINHYFDHSGLIDAFCNRAKQYSLPSYDHVLFSFHGLPERHIRNADKKNRCLTSHCCQQACQENRFCYRAQCYATAGAIAEQLHLNEKNYTVCFQSRLGKEPWIQPYTSDMIHHCAKQGYKQLLVFSPSFICDCLETTHEIGFEYNEEFKKLGGEHLQLVEGLNDHPLWIDTLRRLIFEHQSNSIP
jgi:ferrochelatase